MRIDTGSWHRYMALPAFLLFSLFFLFPLLQGAVLSFTDWDGFSTPRFIGMQNFVDFLQDARALQDVRTTVLFALGSAPLLNLCGLALALLLNKKFHGRQAVRALLYLPAVISPMIMGSIWYLLLQPKRGLLALFLTRAGVSGQGNWMLSSNLALAIIILVNVWQYAGMTMVIYLAGLQLIPKELYESAQIDGANGLWRFLHVTFPLLAASVTVNVVLSLIGTMKVFVMIMVLTNGGPGFATEVLNTYINNYAFAFGLYGYGTAANMILSVLILILGVPVLVFLRRREVEL